MLPFTTDKLGGSHISGLSLAVGLNKRFGIRSVIAAPHGAQVVKLAREMGLETMGISDRPAARRWPSKDLFWTPARVATLLRLGPGTIVHCNDLAALQAWLLGTRLTRRPIVYHNRGFAKKFWPFRFLMRQADHVIPISAACDARLSFIPPARRTILTNPFLTPTEYDAGATREALLRELSAPLDSKLVGFVGNFWRRKRPDFFIEVAARLAASDPNLYFVLFGRDADVSSTELEQSAAAAGLTSRILNAGFRLPPEANIASLDLLLMPAFDEPFGRTPVEALLMGIPYVATDHAGHSEIHARWGGGLVLPKGAGAEAYALACRSVLDNPAAVALGIERRREIASSLTPERHAEEVMAIYRTLLP